MVDAGGDGEWSWVYVDDGKVERAREELLGGGGGVVGKEKGKRRKRVYTDKCGPDSGGNGNRIAGRDGKVMVVGDEFVVQSLILRALLEDP